MKEFADKILLKLKNIKIDGITKRWLINIIGVIAVLFIIAFILSSVAIKNYYYSSVENIVASGASDSAVSYFKNNIEKGNSLEESAAEFVDSYTYKNTTTIWIIDNEGKVILSSSGFAVENQEMPDFEEAMTNESGEARYVGRIGREKVMALTKAIKDKNGAEIGAIRVMSNISEVDDQISTLRFIIFLILLFVMAIIVFSNLYFIRSIIIPVQEINKATKLIAAGNLDVRIEKQYNDEIGDMADSINSMATDIAAADKMKNDFISTISHELRTPLTSIKGWGETLTLGNQDNVDPLTRKGLQVIVSEAGRLEGFVEELLDFSRLQSGRMNLRLAKCDILAELEETLFTFRERAVREGYEVKYSIPDKASVANADANRLKQVFMNILDNALKYSRPGSKILVKADFIKKESQPYVRIAIADQGCGISAEDLPHVKDKFYKANVSVRGSGIGLAVTNEIVTLHGGTLDIDSEVGTGTLVTIILPIEEVCE
ncbi:MAG: HAMP domain-containing protein [Ruminococcaceae bacterium]|nr:HAMP domain-containing protein [Oscillospiraceae bacterium]